MQQNQPVTAFTLLMTFAGRWLAASLLGWAIGFIIILIVLFFVGIYFGIIGLSQDQIMAKAELLTVVVALPVFIGVIPFISAAIAFFWTLSSEQAKAYMMATSGLSQQPQFPQQQPGYPPASQADANARYAEAYQKWQQEYAEYQRKISANQAPQSHSQTPPENENTTR
jgi:hypothetical protein